MDAIETVSALANPVVGRAAASTTAAETTTTTSTSGSTAAKKSFKELFTEAKGDLKTGETLTKVSGHEFARIHGGKRDDMYVNLSGNARSGEAFDRITRGGHSFHVYGTGADRVIVEVGKKAADTTTAATGTTKTSAATTTSGTTSAASTGGATAAA